MNQLHDAEAGIAAEEQGAVGAEPPPPPQTTGPMVHPVRQDPANVNIVNKYNSFNLANVTPPTAPKWKTSDSHA